MEKGIWIINITKCCNAGIMSVNGEDCCFKCGEIINNNDYYKTELTTDEIEFFNL
jgi:hypothetical protein